MSARFEHNMYLLGEAADAALPARYGCCADSETCHDHAEADETAALVTAIRDAVLYAGTDEDAGRAVMNVLLRGDVVALPEISPAERTAA